MMKTLAASVVAVLPAAFAQTYGLQQGTAFWNNVINFTIPTTNIGVTQSMFGPLTCKTASTGFGVVASPADLWPNPGATDSSGGLVENTVTASCGATISNPCIVGMAGITDTVQTGCFDCYKMRITSAAVTAADDPLCGASGCPAYNSTEIFTQVLNGLGAGFNPSPSVDPEALAARTFDFSGLAWVMACPWACATAGTGTPPTLIAPGGTVCIAGDTDTAAAANCANGVIPNVVTYAAGSTFSTWALGAVQDVEYTLVDCATGDELAAPAGASGASGVTPAVMTLAGLISVAAMWAA